MRRWPARRGCPGSGTSTKAAAGHDKNISFEAACDLVGPDLAKEARELSLAVYERGAALAAERGVLIADTKFELGMIDGRLSLCDEVLTPDSSRFWPADEWKPASTPPSFDKQPLRDHLETLDWERRRHRQRCQPRSSPRPGSAT